MIIFTKPRIYGTLIVWLFAVCTLASATLVEAQPQMYRITFRDKGQEAFVPGNAAYNSALTLYHPKALKRRESMGFTPLLQPIDQPINPEYLGVLRAMGLILRAPSAWRNCVISELDTLQASLVAQLPFVASVVRTSLVAYRTLTTPENCLPPNTGESRDMHELINTLSLLEHGTSGSGVRVCLIDEGFVLDKMSSVAHVDISGRYDVIADDDNVDIEPEDEKPQGGHGSLVLSLIAGWDQGQLIGVAPFATYLLAKSEDMRFERRSEEDNFYAAVEWAERNGSDIISASLGYFVFDEGQDKMQYDWLNGKTTFVAQAYNIAAERGVIVVTAAGNGGPTENTIGTPCDADSAICVGGSLRDRSNWPNSSVGPTSDGRIKPDIAALAEAVYAQTAEGNYISVSGTSMSTPQIAGSIALLKQLYPESQPWILREGMYASARAAEEIGDKLGRGIPDIVDAARRISTTLGPGIGAPSIVQESDRRTVLSAIYSGVPTSVSMQFRESNVAQVMSTVIDSLWHAFYIAPFNFLSDTLHGRIVASNEYGTRYYPSDSSWFSIPSSGNVIPCGVRLPSEIVSVNTYTDNNNDIHNLQTYISPSPVIGNASRVVIHNVHETPVEIILVGTSSAVQIYPKWDILPDGNVAMHLPSIASGHYIVVVRSINGVVSVPLIRI